MSVVAPAAAADGDDDLPMLTYDIIGDVMGGGARGSPGSSVVEPPDFIRLVNRYTHAPRITNQPTK